MPKKIQVIVLESKILNSRYNEYRNLDANIQLLQLKNKIKTVMRDVSTEKDYHKNDPVFVVWREYGISDSQNMYLTNDTRTKIKTALKELSLKYPNMIILAGTIATLKPIEFTLQNIRGAASLIDEGYKKYNWLDFFSRSKGDFTNQTQKHRVSAERLFNQSIDFLSSSKNLSIILNRLRNTCLVVAEGKTSSIDKVSPNEEIKSPANTDNTFFQSNNKKGNSSIVESGGIVFGVEICRGHINGVLKHECQSTREKEPIPKIHFILSASIGLDWREFYGEYIIHVDNFEPLTFFLTNTKKSLDEANTEISLYKTSLFDLSDKLTRVSPTIKRVKHLENLVFSGEENKSKEDVALLEKSIDQLTLKKTS